MNTRIVLFAYLLVVLCSAGCANVTSPTGGKKDTRPPKLLKTSPADSQINKRVNVVTFDFDEYITLTDASKEVTLSPILSVPPAVTSTNRRVTVKIPDSLLEDNTTYRLSLGNAVRDLHEGNIFSGYSYTFSTGAYFDSMLLKGSVLNAETGMADTGALTIALYYASASDSAVVRQKPKYIGRTDNTGAFVLKGLPQRSFRIYAMRDANNNLTYDGPVAGDWIGFYESKVTPGDTTTAAIAMKIFREVVDTNVKPDSAELKRSLRRKGASKEVVADGGYKVNVDTPGVKRTFDVNRKAIALTFGQEVTLNREKIMLSYSNTGTDVSVPVKVTRDSLHPLQYNVVAPEWLEDTVYTLKLAKGFAKDSAGADLLPSRYTFRTLSDDDYGKIKVNLPGKYGQPVGQGRYLLLVMADNDTAYLNPVLDTTITLKRLKPAKYTFRIIADKNGNGKWDTGDLFAKLQPEMVIPCTSTVNLKAGWENIVDFEQKPVDKKFNSRNSTPKK